MQHQHQDNKQGLETVSWALVFFFCTNVNLQIRQLQLVFKGLVHATGKRPETRLDWTTSCQLHAFWMVKLIWTGRIPTGCSCNTLLKCAHFEPTLKRNSSEMHVLWPKQYITENPTLWDVENFYHHKNSIVGYNTLYTIVYNWFYVLNTMKRPILISFYLLQLKWCLNQIGPIFSSSVWFLWVLP